MSKQLNKQTNILITATLFALHGMSWAIKAETWYETETWGVNIMLKKSWFWPNFGTGTNTWILAGFW